MWHNCDCDIDDEFVATSGGELVQLHVLVTSGGLLWQTFLISNVDYLRVRQVNITRLFIILALADVCVVYVCVVSI